MRHPLDNPVWEALNFEQAAFGRICGQAGSFDPEVCTLSGLRQVAPVGLDDLAALVPVRQVSGLILPSPLDAPAETWTTLLARGLQQMVHAGDPPPRPEVAAEVLNASDSAAMLALTALTKPGPFGPRTHELGTYLGIKRQGQLVAMAGERMRLPGHTEVSAVCTHPDHLGQGHAFGLITELIHRIRERGETPFLHVLVGNDRAHALYLRLGFVPRTLLHVRVLRRRATPPPVAASARV